MKPRYHPSRRNFGVDFTRSHASFRTFFRTSLRASTAPFYLTFPSQLFTSTPFHLTTFHLTTFPYQQLSTSLSLNMTIWSAPVNSDNNFDYQSLLEISSQENWAAIFDSQPDFTQLFDNLDALKAASQQASHKIDALEAFQSSQQLDCEKAAWDA